MQEKCCAKSKYELIIKTSKSCDLNFSNSRRDTEAKTSPRHLNFLKPLNKTTEMCYPYTGIHVSGFKIHQGTEWVPCNTHITSRNLGIAYGPSFFFFQVQEGVMEEENFWWILILIAGGGPRVVVSTVALHARVRGSVPGLGGFKETKMFLPHPRVKVSIVGSLRDREVACSASDRQGSNFESCVWRTVSSQSSHHPQEVLLAQFSLYVHKSGLKPDSFHFSHPYSHEISNFTLGAPHEKVQGMQTKLHPGFTMGKLVQPFPGISILRDSHIVLSKRS